MKRTVAVLALAFATLLSQSVVLGAQKKRAYKPSERRQQQQAEAEPAQAADAPAGTTYEEEIEAAKAKRDKDLEAAAAAETNRRKLEDRKAEIFAQYAAIVAALRDKYEQSVKDGKTPPPPAQARGKARTKAGRQPPPEQSESAETPPAKAKERQKKQPKNAAGSLEDAQEKLDEENKRHQARLDELNAQLQQAETSGNQREVRRVRKAIEKENNTYNARKTILERKVRELGGTGTPSAPPAPAR